MTQHKGIQRGQAAIGVELRAGGLKGLENVLVRPIKQQRKIQRAADEVGEQKADEQEILGRLFGFGDFAEQRHDGIQADEREDEPHDRGAAR